MRRAASSLLALVLGSGLAHPAAAYSPQIETLAGEIAAKLAETELRAVAVQDFTDLRGEVSELGRFLAEELSAALLEALEELEGPRLIDRLRLGRVLEEMELQSTGLIPPDELREVGRIAGVDALVTGRVTPFVDTLQLIVKVLDVRSAENLFGAGIDLPHTPSLSELETRSLTVVVNPGDCGDVEIDLEGAVLRSVEIAGVEVALRGCVRVDETVHCLLTVTAREEDRSFYLHGGTRLVLPGGGQVPVRRMQVGDGSATGERGRAGDLLVRGVPTAASVSFAGVPQRVESIRRLELDLWGDDPRFEDVPIETP